MGEVVLRCPRLEDAEALGLVHCTVWQQTYVALLTPEAYAALSPERFARGWTRRLAELESDTNASTDTSTDVVTVVAEHLEQGIVGFISVGPARDEGPPASTQLWALNLLSSQHGTGLADRMMHECLGEGPAYLWVGAKNPGRSGSTPGTGSSWTGARSARRTTTSWRRGWCGTRLRMPSWVTELRCRSAAQSCCFPASSRA